MTRRMRQLAGTAAAITGLCTMGVCLVGCEDANDEYEDAAEEMEDATEETGDAIEEEMDDIDDQP